MKKLVLFLCLIVFQIIKITCSDQLDPAKVITITPRICIKSFKDKKETSSTESREKAAMVVSVFFTRSFMERKHRDLFEQLRNLAQKEKQWIKEMERQHQDLFEQEDFQRKEILGYSMKGVCQLMDLAQKEKEWIKEVVKLRNPCQEEAVDIEIDDRLSPEEK